MRSDFFLPPCVRCPICGAAMSVDGGSLVCGGARRHNYDIAKEGYVNLLPPGRARNAKTGDDKDMIHAREAFLSLGGYDRYSAEAASVAAAYLPSGKSITMIDAGCGEGRHTLNMADAVSKICSSDVTALGFDASKFGVRAAAKHYLRRGTVSSFFSAANIFELPVEDRSAELFTSLFAPLPDAEARRVLRDGGILLICAAGADHLREMRELLYDDVIPSGGGAAVPHGFEVCESGVTEYAIELQTPDEIAALFTMTPFYYNATREGSGRLLSRDFLEVTVQVKYTVAKLCARDAV